MFFGLCYVVYDYDDNDFSEGHFEDMDFVLARLINTRGCWFVKKWRNTQIGNLASNFTESAAVRKKVANAVMASKTVAGSKNVDSAAETNEDIQELYENAAKI